MGDDLSGRQRIQRSDRNVRLAEQANMQRLLGCVHGVGECLQGRRTILVSVGEIENSAVLGCAPGRLVRIGKKTHRGTRTDQNQLLRPVHEFDDLLGEIGNAFDLHAPGAALATRREGITGDPRAGRSSDAASRIESPFLQRGSADQHHGVPAGFEHRGGLVDRLGGYRRWRRLRQGGRRTVSLKPRCVGGKDQRSDLTRILQRRLHGHRSVRGDSSGTCRRMHPRGDWPRETMYV